MNRRDHGVFVQAQATTNLSDPTYLSAKQQAHDGAATNGSGPGMM